MNERILSLDLSSTSTGYALFDKTEYIYSGTISCSKTKTKDSIVRILYIVKELHQLIEKYQPTAILIEKLPFTNMYGRETLSYLHGAVKFLSVEKNVPIIAEWNPTHWRKILSFYQGKGKTPKLLKEQSMEYASVSTGKLIDDDNEADAICLGFAYLIKEKSGTSESAPKKKRKGDQ